MTHGDPIEQMGTGNEDPRSDVPHRLSAAKGVNGALCFGEPLRVLTPERHGEPAAIVPLEHVDLPPETRFSIEIAVRVHEGSIALGFLVNDGNGGYPGIVVDRASAWQQVTLATPPIERAEPLLIRNASALGASRAQLRIVGVAQVSDRDLSQRRRQPTPITSDPTAASDLVILLHLPKTGGTTLIVVLANALKPYINIHGDDGGDQLRRFLALPQQERDALRLAYGHMPIGLHRFVKQRCHYVVFLRHPVDRVVSSYYYIMQVPEHPGHRLIRDGMTLATYAALPETGNQQTRRLGRHDFLEILEPAKIHNYWWLNNLSAKLGREDLEQAKECLHSCSFIGFQENLGMDIHDLLRFLGLPIALEIPRINETAERPALGEIDQDTFDLILERNMFDLELYQYAQGMPRRLAGNANDREHIGCGIPLDTAWAPYAPPPSGLNSLP